MIDEESFSEKKLPMEKHGKRKKTKKRHSKEYYENLQLNKINKMRELKWDNRFANQSLPSKKLTAKGKKPNTSSKKIQKNFVQDHSYKDDLKGYKTFSLDPSRGDNRPFKIRIMGKKENERQSKEKERLTYAEKQKTKKQRKRQTLSRKEQKFAQKITEQLKHILIQQLNSYYSESKFSQFHHKMLLRLIQNSEELSTKSIIQSEISRIKNKISSINIVENAIERRENIKKQLITQSEVDKDKITGPMVIEYRLATLSVIEEIIKWKQLWKRNFLICSKINLKLKFEYLNENYLKVMANDMKSMTNNINDPFLLSISLEDFDNQTIIKYRACELLLLEEQLS